MKSEIRLGVLAAVLALAACTSSQQKSAQDEASAAPQQAQDGLIAASVKAKLATIDLDSATAVHVDVARGNVTLSGEVRDRTQRADFENAARSVSGVNGVSDYTKVNPKLRGARESLGDAALAAKVVGALAAQTGVNAAGVKVAAHDGTLTLTGTAPSPAIKTTMLESARKTEGVRVVIDRIEIKP